MSRHPLIEAMLPLLSLAFLLARAWAAPNYASEIANYASEIAFNSWSDDVYSKPIETAPLAFGPRHTLALYPLALSPTPSSSVGSPQSSNIVYSKVYSYPHTPSVKSRPSVLAPVSLVYAVAGTTKSASTTISRNPSLFPKQTRPSLDSHTGPVSIVYGTAASLDGALAAPGLKLVRAAPPHWSFAAKNSAAGDAHGQPSSLHGKEPNVAFPHENEVSLETPFTLARHGAMPPTVVHHDTTALLVTSPTRTENAILFHSPTVTRAKYSVLPHTLKADAGKYPTKPSKGPVVHSAPVKVTRAKKTNLPFTLWPGPDVARAQRHGSPFTLRADDPDGSHAHAHTHTPEGVTVVESNAGALSSLQGQHHGSSAPDGGKQVTRIVISPASLGLSRTRHTRTTPSLHTPSDSGDSGPLHLIMRTEAAAPSRTGPLRNQDKPQTPPLDRPQSTANAVAPDQPPFIVYAQHPQHELIDGQLSVDWDAAARSNGDQVPDTDAIAPLDYAYNGVTMQAGTNNNEQQMQDMTYQPLATIAENDSKPVLYTDMVTSSMSTTLGPQRLFSASSVVMATENPSMYPLPGDAADSVSSKTPLQFSTVDADDGTRPLSFTNALTTSATSSLDTAPEQVAAQPSTNPLHETQPQSGVSRDDIQYWPGSISRDDHDSGVDDWHEIVGTDANLEDLADMSRFGTSMHVGEVVEAMPDGGSRFDAGNGYAAVLPALQAHDTQDTSYHPRPVSGGVPMYPPMPDVNGDSTYYARLHDAGLALKERATAPVTSKVPVVTPAGPVQVDYGTSPFSASVADSYAGDGDMPPQSSNAATEPGTEAGYQWVPSLSKGAFLAGGDWQPRLPLQSPLRPVNATDFNAAAASINGESTTHEIPPYNTVPSTQHADPASDAHFEQDSAAKRIDHAHYVPSAGSKEDGTEELLGKPHNSQTWLTAQTVEEAMGMVGEGVGPGAIIYVARSNTAVGDFGMTKRRAGTPAITYWQWRVSGQGFSTSQWAPASRCVATKQYRVPKLFRQNWRRTTHWIVARGFRLDVARLFAGQLGATVDKLFTGSLQWRVTVPPHLVGQTWAQKRVVWQRQQRRQCEWRGGRHGRAHCKAWGAVIEGIVPDLTEYKTELRTGFSDVRCFRV